MPSMNDDKPILSPSLSRQIEDLCTLVEEIQGDTAHIVRQDNVADAHIQLQDVLNSTEAATHKILDIIMCIQDIADNGRNSAEDKIRIRDYVVQILEACSFQDITGQRIKKVLSGLNALQLSIIKLAQTAKTHPTASSAQLPLEDTSAGLLSGPELSYKAPSQSDIDLLFKS